MSPYKKEKVVTTPDCLSSSSGYMYPVPTYIIVPPANESFTLSFLTRFMNLKKQNLFKLFAPDGTLFKVFDKLKNDIWINYRINTKGKAGIWKLLLDREAEGCYMLRTTGAVDLYQRPRAGTDIEGLKLFAIHSPLFGGPEKFSLFIEVLPGMKNFTIRVNEPAAIKKESIPVYRPDGSFYGKINFIRGRDYCYMSRIECGEENGLWRLDIVPGNSNLQFTTGEHLRIFFGPRLTIPVKMKVKTVDTSGTAVPARVNFISNDRETLFTGSDGEGTAFLYPSNYRLEASHGFEYIPVEREFKVPENCQSQSMSINLEKTIERKKGWYCGEQHVHTTYSDGNNSVSEMVSAAIVEGLDWLGITDHYGRHQNIELSTYSMEEIQAATIKNKFIGIPGQEVPVENGIHCGVIGIKKDVNLNPGRRKKSISPAEITEAVRQQNSFRYPSTIIFNHPPVRALTEKTILKILKQYKNLPNIEIWNMHGYDATQLWFSLLNKGYHIFAVANTDTHDRNIWPPGTYRTYCYSDREFTASNIIKAVREGHSFCSKGPLSYFTINGKIPGETIRAKQKEKLKVKVIVDSVNPVKCIEIIKNGLVIKGISCNSSHFETELILEADENCWYLCHCLNADASLLFPSTAEFTKYLCHSINGDAFTNPIFVELIDS